LIPSDFDTMLFYVKNLTAIFDSDVHVDSWPFKNQNGKLRFNLTNFEFEIRLAFDTLTTFNGIVVPTITIIHTEAYIDPYNLNITSNGGGLFGLVSDIKSLFVGPVRYAVNEYLG